jgi:methyl-coenzyme M reductase subunit C
MIGRETKVITCRKGMGLGLGGGLAQRGTFAASSKADVIAIAMSPGRRHIPKPVCEITCGLRENSIDASVLVLNGGNGIPPDCPATGAGITFGLEEREIELIKRHKLAIIHHGNVKNHLVYKTRFILKRVKIPAIVICQCPVNFDDFEAIGVNTFRKEGETEGEVVGIVTGVIRGQSCPQDKLDEIVRVIKEAKCYLPA